MNIIHNILFIKSIPPFRISSFLYSVFSFYFMCFSEYLNINFFHNFQIPLVALSRDSHVEILRISIYKARTYIVAMERHS